MPRKDKDASNKDELYRVWLAKIQMAKDWHEENKGKEMKEYRLAYEGHQWAEEDKAKYNNEIVDNKLNNEQIIAMHTSLKKNTFIKIINPETSTVVETKIFRKANYPKIFNIVLSKKIATILELDIENPYVEIFEVKKNGKS